jgi:hypothetical protein
MPEPLATPAELAEFAETPAPVKSHARLLYLELILLGGALLCALAGVSLKLVGGS